MFLLTEIGPTVIFMINTRKKTENNTFNSNYDYENKTERLNSYKGLSMDNINKKYIIINLFY
jgi:hypothetical protein